MIFALVGNQNCGKTTLYNRLTGSARSAGNYPGVTVDCALAPVKGHRHIHVMDLPGLYTLEPLSDEESLSLRTLKSRQFDVLINVADATQLRRSLYLTLQLLELGCPMVLALNMMDEVTAAGGRIDTGHLSEALGIPVVPISAAIGSGVENLLSIGEKAALSSPAPPVLAEKRQFIRELLGKTVYLPESPSQRLTRKLDRILVGKYTAIPIFLLIMSAIFVLTFGTVGSFFQGVFEHVIDLFAEKSGLLLSGIGLHPLLIGLITNGIISGVGAVLGFLPMIMVLFFCLSLLEDSGYMARVAFILDRPMSALGLSGRAAVPLLMGFGCSAPAIMSCRTLMSRRERWKTIFLIPFMSCPAKLPVYAAIAGVFFPGREALIMFGLYILGIASAIFAASVLAAPEKEKPPFFLELPVYRMPRLKNVLRLVGRKSKEFIGRAFTVILFTSVTVWALGTLGITIQPVENSADSLLAMVGRLLAPIFAPLGFGSWQVTAALAAGFSAKEAVISSLEVLMNGDLYALRSLLDPADAAALLVFVLLYPPCAAALATAKKELGSGWAALLMMAAQFIIAYAAAMAVRGFLC